MKNVAVISSLIYVIGCAIYFIYGSNIESKWTVFYYVNNGLYIALLLFSNALKEQNIKAISMMITAIVFQFFFIVFQIGLFMYSTDYIEAINSSFWEWIWFAIAGVFVVTYKILNKWENG